MGVNATDIFAQNLIEFCTCPITEQAKPNVKSVIKILNLDHYLYNFIISMKCEAARYLK